MRDYLATADDREVVVLFEVDAVPWRLLLPHGRSAFGLEVAAHDQASAGRPWILRWERYARGRHAGPELESLESIDSVEGGEPAQGLVEAVRAALHFIEVGPKYGCGLARH